MAITEITAPQLRQQDDPTFLKKKARVRELRSVGSTPVVDRFVRPSSTIYFKTASSKFKENGLVYEQGVKLLDLPRTLGDQNLNLQDAVRQAVFEGEVKVYCTCPAYHYWGFKFINTTVDAAIRSEGRFPIDRNPTLRGTVCKHLMQALQVLPFNAGFIMKEVRLRREDQAQRRKSKRKGKREGFSVQADLLSEFLFGMLTAEELIEWSMDPEADIMGDPFMGARADKMNIGPVIKMGKFRSGVCEDVRCL